MKLLLDTHVLVWFAAEPSRLRAEVVGALQIVPLEVSLDTFLASEHGRVAGVLVSGGGHGEDRRIRPG